MAYDIESENLEAHVSICQERYLALADRLQSMDDRIDRIEHMVREIHERIDTMQLQNTDQWSDAKNVVIGILVGVTGFLLSQLIF